jgi:hypothetical protein
MDEAGIRRKLFLLPPVKQSEDKLLITRKSPIIIENNYKKEKSFLQLSVDKFSILTNQPKKVEKFKLTTYPTSAKYPNEIPAGRTTTPSNFKWDTSNMPQIKVTVPNKVPKHLKEKAAEKRMQLLFQQKIALERINSEKRERNSRSQEMLSRSNETLKNIKERMKKRSSSTNLEVANENNDLWASNKYQDINLKSQIINHFYSLDNRHIRFFRKTRPNYYEFTVNRNFEKLVNASAKSYENLNRLEAV